VWNAHNTVFGSKRSAICPQAVSISNLQDVEMLWWIFAVFLEWRPLTLKFSKLCSQSFHRKTDRRCYVEISWNLSDGKSVKSCVIYLTEKNPTPLRPSLLRGSRQKFARASPQQCTQECSRYHSNRFTFGGVMAERVNTVKSPDKVIQYSAVFAYCCAQLS